MPKRDPTEYAYLLDSATLRRWSGKSLETRVALFKMAFPEASLTPSGLRFIYRRAGVKYKHVTFKKSMPLQSMDRAQAQLAEVQRLMVQAHDEDAEVWWTDEVMFTRHSNQRFDWAPKYSNTQVDQRQAFTQYVSVIAAFSFQRGLELIQLHDTGVRIPNFLDFINRIRPRRRSRKLYLYLDGLAVHHALAVRDLCQLRNIVLVFAPVWSPQFQPCERCYASVKRTFKQLKLADLVAGRQVNVEQLVRESFARLTVGMSVEISFTVYVKYKEGLIEYLTLLSKLRRADRQRCPNTKLTLFAWMQLS